MEFQVNGEFRVIASGQNVEKLIEKEEQIETKPYRVSVHLEGTPKAHGIQNKEDLIQVVGTICSDLDNALEDGIEFFKPYKPDLERWCLLFHRRLSSSQHFGNRITQIKVETDLEAEDEESRVTVAAIWQRGDEIYLYV